MPKFLLETQHTVTECAQTGDQFAANAKLLSNTYWGCGEGDHTSWSVAEADNEQQARSQLPPTFRNRGKIRKVDVFTPEQMQEMHKAA